MTPLEAVKALTEKEPIAYSDSDSTLVCVHCGAYREKDFPGRPFEEHRPDCPWLQMPKIVAALEAAERVVFRAFRPDTDSPDRRGYVDELKALAAALKDTP